MRFASLRVYQLLNEPWIYGPRWWRARRVGRIVSRRLAAEHIEWARKLGEKSV